MDLAGLAEGGTKMAASLEVTQQVRGQGNSNSRKDVGMETVEGKFWVRSAFQNIFIYIFCVVLC